MLTALEEAGKKKADKYWPDEEEKVLMLPNIGISVVHESTDYTGIYLQRLLF